MPRKPPSERAPPLTDAERHKRFVEMAHKLDIPDDADLSPELFKKLVKPHISKPKAPSRNV